MNYKDTIRLPYTDFSMKGNLIKKEPETLMRWEEEDLYGKIRDARRDSPKYILHDGPPYANGHVHLGTALNKILKDFIVKSYTMMGYDSPYVPGWDCHGMPIEHKVMGDRPDGGKSLSREEIRRKCRAYALEYVGVQREEFKRLGVFGEWDKPYLTMNYDYESGIVRAFGRMVEDGYVYQGLRPIHWCMGCKTALAEAEVEYADHKSPSIYVAFEQNEPEKWQAKGVPAGTRVVIWTTTPWTLPANLAVALNPREKYVVVESDGNRYLVAQKRAETFMSDAGIDRHILMEPVIMGSELEMLTLRHPVLQDKTSLMIIAEHVTMDDGTGCVHTAPGHGADDFAVGKQYGLEIFNLVLEDGVFSDEAGRYAGEYVFTANPIIVEDLTESGHLISSKSVKHSYPHCWRCKRPLIFRATRQFFLNLGHRNLKRRVLEKVDETNWHPAWGYERMKNMMEVRPDWCLSRQRSWGVALPVFTCDDCSFPVLDHEVIDKVADLVLEKGSDIWFELTPADAFTLAGKKAECPSCSSPDISRVDDILDVWFDSSLSHYNVLTEAHGLSRPAAVYLEATDQHRGWFGVSMITSEVLGLSRPADNIITHGLIQDKQGRKMSKSLGNVMSPLKITERQGADILRLWFAGVDYTTDFRADMSKLDDAREAYRKLRNTIRFMLGNLKDFEEFSFNPSELTGFERYIYLRFRELCRYCVSEYRNFEFHRVFRKLRNFAVIDLSGQYLDMRKDRLYCDEAERNERTQTRMMLALMVRELIKLLAPFMPFTAEEAWLSLPESLRDTESVHLTLFDDALTEKLTSDEESELEAWAPYLDVRSKVLKELEEARAACLIGGGLDAAVKLTVPEGMETSANGENWEDFLIVSQVDIKTGDEITAEVSKTEGIKCTRCWKTLPDVGTLNPADLCGRCAEVVKGLNIEN